MTESTESNLPEPSESNAQEQLPAPLETRLDKLVVDRFGLSRRAAQEVIVNGRIDVDGFLCQEPGRLLPPEAQLTLDMNRPKARRIVDSPIRVLFEDQYLVVIDKQPGVPTTPAGDWETDTLVARVERYFKLRHGDQRPYVGVVHRLDMDTSGVMIFAKSYEVTSKLQEIWRSHDIGREYLAIVSDAPGRPTVTCRKGIVETGVRRRRVARADETGQTAVTHVELVEIFSRRGSLVRCIPETGRTHQIRLHLANLGCPVLGDDMYGKKTRRDQVKPPRLCLHAARLEFKHPMTGENLVFDTQLPDDMAHFANHLVKHERKQDRDRAKRRKSDSFD
ncbi:MAG: RluA family pseudouridine synthase [Planctomycetota bacterium]|nr:RluA family pseudouridine synthase [Planctomycetota bacterium]RLS25347.1 MAG: RluA family pseudouridine synthase [Planctomycetota bacterium]